MPWLISVSLGATVARDAKGRDLRKFRVGENHVGTAHVFRGELGPLGLGFTCVAADSSSNEASTSGQCRRDPKLHEPQSFMGD